MGTSETVSEFGDLFATLARKQKIYQSKEDLIGARPAVLGRFLPLVIWVACTQPARCLVTSISAKWLTSSCESVVVMTMHYSSSFYHSFQY